MDTLSENTDYSQEWQKKEWKGAQQKNRKSLDILTNLTIKWNYRNQNREAQDTDKQTYGNGLRQHQARTGSDEQ